MHREALAAQRRVLGDEHPRMLLSMSARANALSALGDHAAAVAMQSRLTEALGNSQRLEEAVVAAERRHEDEMEEEMVEAAEAEVYRVGVSCCGRSGSSCRE